MILSDICIGEWRKPIHTFGSTYRKTIVSSGVITIPTMSPESGNSMEHFMDFLLKWKNVKW